MHDCNRAVRKSIPKPVATDLDDAGDVPGVAPISDDGSVDSLLFSCASESEGDIWGNNNYDDDASNAHERANLVPPNFNGNEEGVQPTPNIIPAPEGAPCRTHGKAKEHPTVMWRHGADGKLKHVSLSVICQEYKKLNRDMFAPTFGQQEIPPMAQKMSKKQQRLNYKQYHCSIKRSGDMALGCDFFWPITDLQIYRRTLLNNCFWMVSFVTRLTQKWLFFIYHSQIHQYTDTSFPLFYFIDLCMPTSHLFEITIDTAGVLTSRRVSKLSRSYCPHRRKSSGVMESRPAVAAGPGGPGCVRGSSRKSPPPPHDSPSQGAKLIAVDRIHAAVRYSLSHHRSAEAAARTPSRAEPAARTPSCAEPAAPTEAAFCTPNFAEAAVRTLDGTDDEDLSDDSSNVDNEIFGYRGGGVTRHPSPDPSEYPVTNAEVTKFAIVEPFCHYIAGALIGLSNRSAVEACIFMEVGTAIRDLDTMKVPQMEEMFFSKYMAVVHSIPDNRFINESVQNSMLEWYTGAKKINTGRSLFRKYKAHTTKIWKFGLNFPGIKSMNKLPSRTTQLLQMKAPVIAKLWKSANPVSLN